MNDSVQQNIFETLENATGSRKLRADANTQEEPVVLIDTGIPGIIDITNTTPNFPIQHDNCVTCNITEEDNMVKVTDTTLEKIENLDEVISELRDYIVYMRKELKDARNEIVELRRNDVHKHTREDYLASIHYINSKISTNPEPELNPYDKYCGNGNV